MSSVSSSLLSRVYTLCCTLLLESKNCDGRVFFSSAKQTRNDGCVDGIDDNFLSSFITKFSRDVRDKQKEIATLFSFYRLVLVAIMDIVL